MGNEKPAKTDDKPKDRIDIRLFNTIVIYDVYTAARTGENARESLLAAIASGEAKPNEIVAREVTMQNSIRASWLDQKPWYATDITDEEFESLKEHPTGELWHKLYKKAK